jgi:hypothetical protein
MIYRQVSVPKVHTLTLTHLLALCRGPTNILYNFLELGEHFGVASRSVRKH